MSSSNRELQALNFMAQLLQYRNETVRRNCSRPQLSNLTIILGNKLKTLLESEKEYLYKYPQVETAIPNKIEDG